MSSTIILNVGHQEPGRNARSRLLERAGYHVVEACNGKDALEQVDKQRPSLVVVDVNLPDIDGLEVCRRIRSDDELASIAVLLISASAVPTSQQASGLDSGADAYLVEPVTDEVLLATVRTLLRLRKAELELKRLNVELRRANTELQKANDTLKSCSEDVVRFAYLASHDLQEQLRSIRIFASLLDRQYGTLLEGSGKEYLQYIDNAGVRMSSLISDLLVYAQSGEKVSTQNSQVRMDLIVAAARADLDPALEESFVELCIGPMPVVQGDGISFIRLFQNLISNAIKYRVYGLNPRLEIRAEKHVTNSWIFSVQDNGVGIEQMNLNKIFEPFKRLHGQEIPGNGLGLATCRRIVEGHGGQIWAESDGMGKGSTFYFILPGPTPLA